MSRLRAFKFNGGKATDICNLIKENKKEKKIEIKIEKIFKRCKTKNLYPEAREVMPALKSDKINRTYMAVKPYPF
jgi:carboxypeptidase C (cathepsin A)